MKDKTIAELAALVREDWKNPYFGARTYIKAMLEIHKHDPRQVMYGDEQAVSVIKYFLANASKWRGDIARQVKAELKERVGL